jgi:peptide/nickel transport system permease protein
VIRALASQLVRRLVRAAATLVALAVVAWLCLEAAPGDPAEQAARVSGQLPRESERIDPRMRERILRRTAQVNGLDRPLHERLGHYLRRAAAGDLGRSWRDGRSVRAAVVRALPTTLVLILAGLAGAYLMGVALALAAAARPGGARDRLVTALCVAALSVPTAWAAVLALRSFAAGHPWSWFPPSGGWVLPILCISYVSAAVVARYGRALLVDAAGEPFTTAARARGASAGRVLGIHALGVARAPLASLLASLVPYLLGATLIVERAFDLRGLGSLLVAAAGGGDAPMVLGVTLTAGAIVMLSSLAADLLAVAADPRLREGA